MEPIQFLHYPETPAGPFMREYDLICPVVERAVVTPIRREPRKIVGGVYDGQGSLVPHSQRNANRGSRPYNPAQLDGEIGQQIDGRSFFAGLLFAHFGHSLIETPSRFWALPQFEHSIDRFIFQAWSQKRTSPTMFDRAFMKVIFEGLNIDPNKCIIVAAEPILCEELVVPASAITINGFVHPRFIDPYDRISALPKFSPGSRSKVYFSRRGLADARRQVENEEAIEQLAVDRGFEILRPELMPFEDQIRLMKGVDIVAGCDGSALHMAAFAKPQTRLLSFESRPSYNQYGVEAARGCNAVHVFANAAVGRRRFKATVSDSGDSLERGWRADMNRVADGFDAVIA